MLILATIICAVGAVFLVGLGVYAEHLEVRPDSNHHASKVMGRRPK